MFVYLFIVDLVDRRISMEQEHQSSIDTVSKNISFLVRAKSVSTQLLRLLEENRRIEGWEEIVNNLQEVVRDISVAHSRLSSFLAKNKDKEAEEWDLAVDDISACFDLSSKKFVLVASTATNALRTIGNRE
jgi:hypothetical protein